MFMLKARMVLWSLMATRATYSMFFIVIQKDQFSCKFSKYIHTKFNPQNNEPTLSTQQLKNILDNITIQTPSVEPSLLAEFKNDIQNDKQNYIHHSNHHQRLFHESYLGNHHYTYGWENLTKPLESAPAYDSLSKATAQLHKQVHAPSFLNFVSLIVLPTVQSQISAPA